MIVEKALRIAGPGSVLARRPAGVLHVYTGPLTPSGRYVPRAGRTACRARTRRLTVVAVGYSDCAGLHRLCARCSACLSGQGPTGRQVERPRTRLQYRAAFSDVTAFDLVLAVLLAETPDELDQVAHLSLALFDHIGCKQLVTTPDGRELPSLHDHIRRHRQLLDPTPTLGPGFDERIHDANARRRAERKALREQREEQIRRIGFVNATRR